MTLPITTPGLLLPCGGALLPPWSVSKSPAAIYHINPATGNDSNSGKSAGQAWASDVPLLAKGTLTPGVWEDALGNDASLDTVTTNAAWDAWYAQYLAGNRKLVGGTAIVVDTSGAPLRLSGQWAFPAVEIVSAKNSLTDIRIGENLSDTWTQPDAGAAPNVWATTKTIYASSGLYEGQGAAARKQLLAIAAYANFAAAKSTLQSTAGSCYADPATGIMYTHRTDGGNPNGQPYEFTPAWAISLNAGRAIDIVGGRCYLLGVDGGLGFDYTTAGTPTGCEPIGMGEWGTISVFDSCQGSGGAKHIMDYVGSLGTGCVAVRNCVTTLGPGGSNQANWDHIALYTSFSGTGSIRVILDGNSSINGVANVGSAGGYDANPSSYRYAAVLLHTNDETKAFAYIHATKNTWRGIFSIGINCNLLVSTDDTFHGMFASLATTTNVTATTPNVSAVMDYSLPYLLYGTATLTGIKIAPTNEYAGMPPLLGATASLVGCAIDFSGASIYSGAWSRSQALTSPALISGGTLNVGAGNAAYGLVYGTTSGDVVGLTGGLAITSTGGGTAAWAFAFDTNSSFNTSSPIKLYTDAAALGWIDGTVTMNGSAWTQLAGLTSVLHVESSAGHTWKDTAGTSPVASNGDLVARRDDLSGNANNLLQATSGNRPTWVSATPSVAYLGSSSQKLTHTAISLAGAFTIYAVANRAVSNALILAGYSGADQYLMVFSDNTAYFSAAGGAAGTFYETNGHQIFRVRRTAAGAVYMQVTGQAEVELGTAAGTFTFDIEGERPAASQYSTSSLDAKIVFNGGDFSTAGGDDAAIAWAKALSGLSWP